MLRPSSNPSSMQGHSVAKSKQRTKNKGAMNRAPTGLFNHLKWNWNQVYKTHHTPQEPGLSGNCIARIRRNKGGFCYPLPL